MMFANSIPKFGMALSPTADPHYWHDFTSSFSGASAALLGLAFVAIALNLDAILKDKQLPSRAVETLAFFAYSLAGSLLLQVPGWSHVGVGVGLAVLTVGVGAFVVFDLPRWKRERMDPLSWRLTHLAPAVVITFLSGVGSVAAITSDFGGLYWLAGSMTVATAAGIVNSWVLLVEIKR